MDKNISGKTEYLRKISESGAMLCVTYQNSVYGDSCVTAIGLLDRIDGNKQTLILSSGIEIPFSDIINIETWGDIFSQ